MMSDSAGARLDVAEHGMNLQAFRRRERTRVVRVGVPAARRAHSMGVRWETR